MKELVFLLEEASARAMLESLLPRLLAPDVTFRLIPFEGKQDLEKQIAKKHGATKIPKPALSSCAIKTATRTASG